MPNIIAFELNEVPWRIINYYVAERPASTLASIMQSAAKYETYAEDAGHLSPWKTWPTVHRGVTAEKHGLHDLGMPLDEIDAAYPPVWSLLSRSGVRVGVFGSLHSYPPSASHCFHVPDPFAPFSDCYPDYIQPFQSLCLKMSRESARNVSRSVPVAEAFAFLSTAPRTGVRAATILALIEQLAAERVKPWRSVRRRTFQSVLAFDVFMKQLTLHKPHFSTFFTNHVASSMHRYWAAAFPEDYAQRKYEADWIDTFKYEIQFAMDWADHMLKRLVRFVDANPDYRLMVLSSMGQQAIEHEVLSTQLWIRSPDVFFRAMGAAINWEERPAMFPQFNCCVAEGSDELERILQTVAIDGEKLKYRREGNFFSLDFGHENAMDAMVMIGDHVLPAAECGLENLEVEDKSTSSAYHIPEGTMLLYGADTRPTARASALSTLEVAPYVLANFGVSVPSYMRGSSLIQ